MWQNCLRKSRQCFDVIALDVDNGPEGLTKRANDWLYSMSGIAAAQRALTSLVAYLAYWSADPDSAFHDRLRRLRIPGGGGELYSPTARRAQGTPSGWPVWMVMSSEAAVFGLPKHRESPSLNLNDLRPLYGEFD